MVVQHNMQAANASRTLNITTDQQSKSTEKLSSGYKINRAADDAAGLSISEKMRKQIRGLTQASTNASDGVSSVQTAEGALTEVHDMLQRMNELAVQAANGTNSESDRDDIQNEIDQLSQEIDRIASTTKFNETFLLKGDIGLKRMYIDAHDAGLDGTLIQNTTKATFTMESLEAGERYRIGGVQYTIGAEDNLEVVKALKFTSDMYTDNGDGTVTWSIAAGDTISIDGKTYTINDTSVGTDVANAKAEINGYLNAYKALEHSSYDFKAKTAVDYANKNAINATIDGWTKRKVSGGQVYYLNDYEVDTDHKNADLYKASGLGDCHGARAKLSTGEVHDLKKKAILSGYNDVATVTHDDADNYYLLDVLGMINNVSFIEKLTDTSKGTITYAIGAETVDVVNVLKQFNNSLRLNPLGECSVDVKAFGDFVDSSVTVKNFKFKIVIKDGAFSELSLVTNGKMNVSFPDSRDFTSKQDAGYKLEYTLTVTDEGSNYEPAATVDKVK